MRSTSKLTKWLKVTKSSIENKFFPQQQGEYLKKVSDFMPIFPYGMHANLPLDNLGLIIDESGRLFIGTSAVGRFLQLEQDEVAFFHEKTQSYIYFRNSGDIDIDTTNASGDININTVNVNVTASESVNVEATEDINLTADNLTATIATNATIECPVIELNASTSITFDTPIATFTTTVQIDGNLTVDGSTTLSATVTSNSVDISDTHVHTDVTTGLDDTGAPKP